MSACFLSWSILHEIQIMGFLLLLLPLSLLFVAEDCPHCHSYDGFHHSHETLEHEVRMLRASTLKLYLKGMRVITDPTF